MLCVKVSFALTSALWFVNCDVSVDITHCNTYMLIRFTSYAFTGILSPDGQIFPLNLCNLWYSSCCVVKFSTVECHIKELLTITRLVSHSTWKLLGLLVLDGERNCGQNSYLFVLL